jgi:hypothetical protein
MIHAEQIKSPEFLSSSISGPDAPRTLSPLVASAEAALMAVSRRLSSSACVVGSSARASRENPRRSTSAKIASARHRVMESFYITGAPPSCGYPSIHVDRPRTAGYDRKRRRRTVQSAAEARAR